MPSATVRCPALLYSGPVRGQAVSWLDGEYGTKRTFDLDQREPLIAGALRLESRPKVTATNQSCHGQTAAGVAGHYHQTYPPRDTCPVPCSRALLCALHVPFCKANSKANSHSP